MIVMTPHVLIAIARSINLTIPVVADEIYRAAAGVIHAAITTPVARMLKRNMQVHRSHCDAVRRLNDYRPGIEQLRRRVISDINTAVKIRVADIKRYADTDICCTGR
jgi:hypothetical protein